MLMRPSAAAAPPGSTSATTTREVPSLFTVASAFVATRRSRSVRPSAPPGVKLTSNSSVARTAPLARRAGAQLSAAVASVRSTTRRASTRISFSADGSRTEMSHGNFGPMSREIADVTAKSQFTRRRR